MPHSAASPGATRPTAHASHDLVLLASAADREDDPGTAAIVAGMTAACPECAAIADDLRALARGLADLPPTVVAPRDMRLSPDQAARLRRGGLWRRLLEPFGVDGLPGLRPFAGALTAIGLAGLILTSFPLRLAAPGAALIAPGSNTSSQGKGSEAYGAQSPTPVIAPGAGTSAPQDAAGSGGAPVQPGAIDVSPPPPGQVSSGPPPSVGTVAPIPGGPSAPPNAPATDGGAGPLGPITIPPLTLVSILLLAAGIGLLSLRVVARRID